MKTRLVLAAVLLITAAVALVSECHAGTQTTSTESTCRRIAGGGTTCRTSTSIPDGRPDRELTKAERADVARDNAERDARIEKWEAFCKPVGVVDAYGVTRLTYAHKNCDLGRSE